MNYDKYKVELLDANGVCIVCRTADTLKSAKQTAKYMLTTEWASISGTDHISLGTEKTEVRNRRGECLWDKFREQFDLT